MREWPLQRLKRLNLLKINAHADHTLWHYFLLLFFGHLLKFVVADLTWIDKFSHRLEVDSSLLAVSLIFKPRTVPKCLILTF